MNTPTDEKSWQVWFEQNWAQREDQAYPGIFGPFNDTLFTLSEDLFKQLGINDVDPRWLTHGVLEAPPHASRNNWAYVTTALSNPWGQRPEDIVPGQHSGLGCEFFILTPHKAIWPVKVLQWLMAVEILTATGKIAGELIEPMDRIPLGGAINAPGKSLLGNLLICTPEDMPDSFELASGKVDLLLCVGISDAEMQFAKAQSSEGLIQLLRHHGYIPVSDPNRPSVV